MSLATVGVRLLEELRKAVSPELLEGLVMAQFGDLLLRCAMDEEVLK